MKYDIIIIGAGAAGLMAMHDLLQAGYRVCMLEASAIPGGRIATIQENGFDQPIETGAEFVHGKLPLTLSLLKMAGINYIPVAGKMIVVHNEKWNSNEAHDKHWETFMRSPGKLKTDTSIGNFLQEHFSGNKYNHLRDAVQHYAEGFDLAAIDNASAMAFYREWSHEDENYRIPGGYMQLINYLLKKCNHQNASLHFNSCASRIEYNEKAVAVYTTDNRCFEASTVLVTVSAGVLQAGMLQFFPALEAHYTNALQQLGYGSVVKILLQFTTAFWKKKYDSIGFLLSDEVIPTWWTQLPVENNLLTGWLGCPGATIQSGKTEAQLLQLGIESLCNIFDMAYNEVEKELSHYSIHCWHNHPYVKGGYSYVTVNTAVAKKILAHPAAGTVFFAGEALYNGQSQGTVEAALQSGQTAAKKIVKQLITGASSPQQ